jgi:hypothetical protein
VSNRVRTLLSLTLLLLATCAEQPVEWGAISYRRSQSRDPDTRSAIMSANLPEIAGAAESGSCIRSIRAQGDSLDRFRVWWSPRPDSSVVLAAQRSSDRGGTWRNAVIIDSTDRGRRGCARPPPGTAFDPRSGYLYVAYYIEPRTGAGIYFAHSMDRGELFHAPVPVIYGKRPVEAGVTGRGDSVVVVFEDPNAGRPRIGYALSHTSGHFFEKHGRVTPDEESATTPWVAFDGARITAWWKNGDRVGFRSGVWK